MNLYESCQAFTLHQFNSREEWLKGRESRIGGSEASSLLEMNPYCSLNELWHRKINHKESDISNELTDYGNRLEAVLREMFIQKHQDLDVQYIPNAILYSNGYEWMSYSPDSLTYDGSRKGILEIKTSLIRNSEMGSHWKDKIPDTYFIQVLHGLLVTEFEYVDLIAELRYFDGNSQIRQYHIERQEVLDDLEWLLDTEQKNWNTYFIGNIEPPITIKI